MANKLVTLSPPPPVNGGKRTGARLKSAAIVLGFAVLAAIGFDACKLSGETKDDEPDGGSQFVPISLSKTEDIIFKDEVNSSTFPYQLKADINQGLTTVVDLVWSVTDDNNILTNPPDSSSDDMVTITPNGNVGKATVTATIASKVDGDGNNVVEGLETLGPLVVSYELTVLELPVVTINTINDIMLEDGNNPREIPVSASYTLDDNTPSDWRPAAGNTVSSFVWQIVSGDANAEFVSTEGTNVTLKAKQAGAVTVRAVLTLPGKSEYAEAAFNITNYDHTQVPHQSITITGAPQSIIATDTKSFSVSFSPAAAYLGSIRWVYDTTKFSVTASDQNNIRLYAMPGVDAEATYTIKAESMISGSTAGDEFTVTLKPLTVTVNGNASISKGDSAAAYTAAVNADDNKAVTWSVEPSGNVTMTGALLTNTTSVKVNTPVTVKATSQADTSRYGTKSVTLTPPKYTLVYDANGGSGSPMANETNKSYGTAFNLKANTYTKTGFNFSNWSTVSTGTEGKTYANQESVDIDPPSNNGTVTLYARWTLANYSIVYNLNGGTQGSGAVNTYTVETNTFNLPVPAQAGNVFSGWYEDAAFTGNAVTQIPKGTTGNKAFYAKWEWTLVDSPDLMVKFGVKSAGYTLSQIGTADVTNTFNRVKDYIKTQDPSQVNPAGGLGAIKLGDYVDLASLKVDAYNGNSGAIANGSSPLANKELAGHGTLLRLIVVGINIYYDKNDNGTGTSHLIFNFLNIPGKGRIQASNDNRVNDRYATSEMRTYLTGNYWTGLKNAGVPESAVMRLNRIVGTGENPPNGVMIDDLLWLPTAYEYVGSELYQTEAENAGNQGHMAYYTDTDKGKKYDASNTMTNYLTASRWGKDSALFPTTTNNWYSWNGGVGAGCYYNDVHGVAPGFAVGEVGNPALPKTVTYDKNGGTGTAPAAVTAAVNTVITLPQSSGLSRAGAVFDGWNTHSDGTGVNYNAGATFMLNKDITFYARWHVPTVTKDAPGEETWTVPVSGYYHIETWGAQGNNAAASGTGGKGGYSQGQRIALNAGDVLTLKIGAQGGGGTGGTKADLNKAKGANGGAGGGLSSVRKGSETLIVAGGGGGAGGGSGTYNSAFSDTGEPYGGTAGGAGGGAVFSPPTNGATADRSEWTELVPGGGGTGGGGGGINGGNGASGTKSYFGTNYMAGGGGGGGGAGYANGNGGGGGTMFRGGGGGGGSGYAKTGADGFSYINGGAGVQSGNGKIVITHTY